MKHWVYTDIYAFRVWMHILLRTQYSREQTQNFFNGTWITQEYGEFVYGRESWSKLLQVPEQRLRTIMKKFEKEGMIRNTEKVYPKCSLLSVANYAKFNQQINQQINQQNSLQPEAFQGYANQQINQTSTGDQPASNRRSTTIKKDKTEKKEKTVNKQDKLVYGLQSNVLLTEEELDKLRTKYENLADEAIEYLSLWIVEKEYKSSSHYSAIQRWVIDAVQDRKAKAENRPQQKGEQPIGHNLPKRQNPKT